MRKLIDEPVIACLDRLILKSHRVANPAELLGCELAGAAIDGLLEGLIWNKCVDESAVESRGRAAEGVEPDRAVRFRTLHLENRLPARTEPGGKISGRHAKRVAHSTNPAANRRRL